MPRPITLVILTVAYFNLSLFAQSTTPPSPTVAQQKIIIDTDIGGDIDDAFAVALALRSPELNILGITTTTGDTESRAKLLDRFLGEAGRENISVAAGKASPTDPPMSQQRYAEGGHFGRRLHPEAAGFILDQIRRHPNEITLVAIGPLGNLGAAIDREPATFRQLKRIVMMGGSINLGYGDLGYSKPRGPSAEWNIAYDIPSARKVFASGVPLYVMPLDSTQLKLDEIKREYLFQQDTPITDALTILYHLWGQATPTLYDPMTIAYSVDPQLCPVEPVRIRVDDKGYTRSEPGTPNAQVCLHSDPEAFFHFYLGRVALPYGVPAFNRS